METTDSRLSRRERASYAVVSLPVGILHQPSLSVLPALYAQYAGLPLETIGIILLATRVLDAVVDPLIGHGSDRTSSRLGARKPWILGGALLAAVSVWFLFRPSSSTGALYFLVWSSLLYVGWSLIEIPHTAWINDLTRSYHERSRLATYRYVAYTAGGMAFLVVPLLPFFETTEITPRTTAFASWIAIILLPVVTLIALSGVRHGALESGTTPSLRAVWSDAARNRVLWWFLLAVAASYMASGMIASLYLFFLGSYLGIADKYAHLNLAASASFLIGAPIWLAISLRIGKHRALALCVLMQGLTMVAFASIPSGPQAFPIALVVWTVSGLAVSGGSALSLALLADVVDYGAWRSGSTHAGNYFAAFALTQKLGVAMGGGLGLIIVGLFGFEPRGANDGRAMAGFFLVFVVLPVLLNALAAFAIWRFPLDRKLHAAISRRLTLRSRRSAEDLGTAASTEAP